MAKGSLTSRARLRASFGALRVLVAVAVAGSSFGILAAAVTPTPAGAAVNLTVRKNTWDIVGLRSNVSTSNIATSPRVFPIGIEICNAAGSDTATGVTASLGHGTIPNASGSTPAFGNLAPVGAQAIGDIPGGTCRDVQYSIAVVPTATTKPQLTGAFGKTLDYTWTVSRTGGSDINATGTLYVEKLVRQNRNAILRVDSAACLPASSDCYVYAGQTYTFTLYSKSAPNGYEQTEAFLDFPMGTFEVLDVKSRYSAPPNGTAEGVYADGCGWDNATRACVGPPNYPGGKVGGNLIRTTYTVKVRTGATAGSSSTLSALIYDLSGSSFHYNADYGSGTTAKTLRVLNPADLSIDKSHTGTFIRGAQGIYNLTVTNHGTSDSATPVTIVDTLPAGAGISFPESGFATAGTSGFSCVRNSALQVTCTRNTAITNGASTATLQLHVDVAADASPSFTNRATVSQTSATINDPNSANNTDTDPTTTALGTDADLVVTNTATTAIARGQVGQYQIEVRNDGPETVPGPIVVSYTLSQGVTPTGAAGTGWVCVIDGQTVTCTHADQLSSLQEADPIIVDVTVAADAPDPVITSATAISTSEVAPPDPNAANNTDVRVVKGVGTADLAIDKTNPGLFAISPEAGPYNTGTFTITVSNNGPDAAAASATDPIRVTDTLPSELVYVSATGTGWSCSVTGGVLTCDRSTPLASGAQSAITLTMQVPKATEGAVEGLVLNSATVSGPTSDPNLANNTSDDAAALRAQTDVDITKVGPNTGGTPNTITATSSQNGATVAYTVTVTNNGPNPATGVYFTDTMPPGSRFLSVVKPGNVTVTALEDDEDCSGPAVGANGEITCSIGALAVSGTSTWTINVGAFSGQTVAPIVNTVEVFSDQVDPDATNIATYSNPCTNCVAAPTVSYTAGPETVDEHGTTTRTYSWTATHPTINISAVTTSCGLAGVRQSNSTSGIGTLSASGTFTCVFDDGPATSNVTVTANAGANAVATATRVVTINNVPPATTIAADSPQDAGATYTVTLGVATDVSTADAAGQILYAVDCGTGDGFSEYTTSRTFSCVAPATGPVTVQGRAIDKDGGVSTVVSTEVEITPEVDDSADVAVDKTGPASAAPGDGVLYTITVTNNGPASATGVTVVDTLPDDLEDVTVDFDDT
ncbi:MAG TPA: hypothetical protein VM262_11480, partial [Acidimicrobiales bacterium]|nr:hypothetical protein [Acidimicrobiales bacterium]